MLILVILIWRGPWPSDGKMTEKERMAWKTAMNVFWMFFGLRIVLWDLIIKNTGWISDTTRSSADTCLLWINYS